MKKAKNFSEMRQMQQGNHFDSHGCYTCIICGKLTRNTNTGEAQAEMCKSCYQENEQQNAEDDQR
jgi:hypothetical protein